MPNALHVDIDGPVATLTLTGPGKGNALGLDFVREAPGVLAGLEADTSIRAIVLQGAGPHFCFGLDLTSAIVDVIGVDGPNASAAVRTQQMREIREFQDAVSALANSRVPVISAVSGWCIGGGVDLIAATDIRLASADAIFSIREARMAIVADLGSLQRLEGVIGQGHLRELAYTGRDFDASYAARIGLVNSVHEDQTAVQSAALALAREIAANAPLAVQGTKEALDQPRRSKIDEGLRWMSVWNAAYMRSHDLNEAVSAFNERRPPVYRGE